MYEVVSLFLYRKEVTSRVVSIHKTKDAAIKWAMYHCSKRYGDVYDVSYHGEVRHAVSVRESPVFGPKDPWQNNIFYVRELPPVTEGLPPISFIYDDEE